MKNLHVFTCASLLGLLVGGCEPGSLEGDVPSFEGALVTDADLAAATRLAPAQRAALYELELGNLGAVPTRETASATTSLQASAFGEPGAEEKGHLAYVEQMTTPGAQRYAVRLDDGDEAEIIYEGRRPIQSVATSADGGLVSFSLQFAPGDHDAYLVDRAGDLGAPGLVYILAASAQDEVDVSMSLDGSFHAWGTEHPETGQIGYEVLELDRNTGFVLSFQPFFINLGGVPIPANDPSVTGSGGDVFFASDNDFIRAILGAPIIVSFATDGSAGALVYAGVPGASEAIRDPSGSFDGDAFLFVEDFAGTTFLSRVEGGSLLDIVGGLPVEHPHLTASGLSMAFGIDDAAYTGTLDLEALTFQAFPVRGLDSPFKSGEALFWAKELPPPPPGSFSYDGALAEDGPSWVRPFGQADHADVADPRFLYHAQPFTAEASGFFTFRSVQDYDGYLLLYEGSFDPAAPQANLVTSNDDLGNNRSSGFSAILEEGSNYVLVTSSWAYIGFESDPPEWFGTFTNTALAPVPLLPGDPPRIEEIAKAAGTRDISAPGDTVGIQFFVSSADPITCAIDWGDGTSEAVACGASAYTAASHVYDAPGYYEVRVTAQNVGGSATATIVPTVADPDSPGFDLTLVFEDGGFLSASQRQEMIDAADRWSEILTTDLPTTDLGPTACGPIFDGVIDDVALTVVVRELAPNVLGSAGPCTVHADVFLPTLGVVNLNSENFDFFLQQGLFETVAHEYGHVLGFGTFWGFYGVIDNGGLSQGEEGYDPVFTGENACAVYDRLLADAGRDPVGECAVPAEDVGGGGSIESHWRESVFGAELMTSVIDSGVTNPLSELSAASMIDIGWDVTTDTSAFDPYALPGAGLRSATGQGYVDEVILPKGWR